MFTISAAAFEPLLGWMAANGEVLLLEMNEDRVRTKLRGDFWVIDADFTEDACPRGWRAPDAAWLGRVHEFPLAQIRDVISGAVDVEVSLPCAHRADRFVVRRLDANGGLLGTVEVCEFDTRIEWIDFREGSVRFSATFHTRELLCEVDRAVKLTVDAIEYRRGEDPTTLSIGGTAPSGTTVYELNAMFTAARDIHEFTGTTPDPAPTTDETPPVARKRKPAASSVPRKRQLVLDLKCADPTFEKLIASARWMKRFLACASFTDTVRMDVVHSEGVGDLFRLTPNVTDEPTMMVTIYLASMLGSGDE